MTGELADTSEEAYTCEGYYPSGRRQSGFICVEERVYDRETPGTEHRRKPDAYTDVFDYRGKALLTMTYAGRLVPYPLCSLLLGEEE
ncbi:MAG: hypothetical protein LBH75_01270 [Treponema sp.]|jgi:hypothetical protein|nr:hypothetical protein [Treponema sp.]